MDRLAKHRVVQEPRQAEGQKRHQYEDGELRAGDSEPEDVVPLEPEGHGVALASHPLNVGERGQNSLHELGDADGGHQDDYSGSVEQATDDGPFHDGADGDADH